MLKKIVIDPGHGGSDPGAAAGGLLEKDFTLDISRRLAKKLSAYQARIFLTRSSDIYVSLQDRPGMANRNGADFFLSIHVNAGGGKGFESYVKTSAPALTRTIRETLHREAAVFFREWGAADRGMKAADFAVLRLAQMPAVLMEVLFIDSPADVPLLKNTSFLDGLAGTLAGSLAAILGLAQGGPPGTPARAPADTHPDQARRFLADKNPGAPDFVSIYTAMEPIYNIRWDAVFAQSLKETGFWRFGGLVQPAQNNFSGLGAFGGSPGDSFETPGEGIEAQFQHWHVYYHGGNLPAGRPVLDPRRKAVLSSGLAGTLEFVEDLGGNWAPSPDYGSSIIRDYLDPMKKTPVPGPAPGPWDPQKEIDKLKESGIIVSPHSPGDFVTWGEFATVLNKLTPGQREHKNSAE